MNNIILVAGATGNLGGKIVDVLLLKGAIVRALVRPETDESKIKVLRDKGVKVFQIDMTDKAAIAKHCKDVMCVVSALAGLKETIIDTQKILLDAAVEAKVPRFIPSDYSTDFRDLVPGKNRNLDYRRDFHSYLDQVNIKSTTIFNGPFMDLLTTDMPLILFKQNKILCWGNKYHILEFTTTFNVAEYTANVAIDNNSPRYLCIAGDTLSCDDFVNLLTKLSGKPYKILRPGGIGLLNILINVTRFFSPGKNELYPAWQGMQYMRDIMEGRAKTGTYDNDRYPNINWTKVEDFLLANAKELKSK